MTTQGDRVLDRPLAQVGGKGLFIKELEIAIAENRADIAVHSMKDVPSELPPGMIIAAMLPRADAARRLRFAAIPRFHVVAAGRARRHIEPATTMPAQGVAPRSRR